MRLFGHRKPVPPDVEQRLAHLELELNKTQSELRQLEAEQLNLHDQVRKWMRRAVAAAERNQERASAAGAAPAEPVTPASPSPLPGPWRHRGAAARIAARRARQAEQAAAAVNGNPEE